MTTRKETRASSYLPSATSVAYVSIAIVFVTALVIASVASGRFAKLSCDTRDRLNLLPLIVVAWLLMFVPGVNVVVATILLCRTPSGG